MMHIMHLLSTHNNNTQSLVLKKKLELINLLTKSLRFSWKKESPTHITLKMDVLLREEMPSRFHLMKMEEAVIGLLFPVS